MNSPRLSRKNRSRRRTSCAPRPSRNRRPWKRSRRPNAQIDANAAAEVAKIGAQADLEVTKIQADAAEYAGQKEAAKNKAISGCLTEHLIRYYYIQQWNGKLPETYLGSDNVSTIIGLGEKAVPAEN